MRTYSVYRFLDGIRGGAQGAFPSLYEAYMRALDLRRRDPRANVDFRICGPALKPELYDRLAKSDSPIPTALVWYVLDSSRVELPAIRASDALRLLDPGKFNSSLRPSRPVGAISKVTERPLPRPPQRKPAQLPDSQNSNSRISSPETSMPQKRRRRHKSRSVFDAAETGSRRRRHDWEIEDRDGDISLVVRDEDELGIGIPAQTGKGRRSRRGQYIP